MACSDSVRAPLSLGPEISDDIVTISVGVEERKFIVHREVLQCSAPYFKAALSNSWSEGQSKHIVMVEDDPDSAKLYFQWLYTRKIWCDPEIEVSKFSELPQAHDDEIRGLLKAYCFGEKIQDNEFKDSALDCIIAWTKVEDATGQRYFPGDSNVCLVWDNTPSHSPLRQLILDQHIWEVRHDDTRKIAHVGFLQELVFSLLENSKPKGVAPYRGASSCRYHAHGDGKLCYKEKRGRGHVEAQNSE